MTADAHEKVIWFDISVDEVLCVYIFNPADHLKMKKMIVKYFTKLFTIVFSNSLHDVVKCVYILIKVVPSIQLEQTA